MFGKVIKSIHNSLTGKSAEISIELDKPAFGLPFKATVELDVSDQNLKCKKIILKVRGVESVAIPDISTRDAFGKSKKKTETRFHKTFEKEFVVSRASELDANSHYAWEYEVILPDAVKPEYFGKYAKHEYQIQAEVITFGVNPATGWMTLYSDRI